MTTPPNDSPPPEPKRRPQRPGKLPRAEKPIVTIQPDVNRPNQPGLLDRLLEWLSRKPKGGDKE